MRNLWTDAGGCLRFAKARATSSSTPPRQTVWCWVVLLVACALESVAVDNNPDRLISADTMLPAEFTWDVLHHHQAWVNFQQARVPSLLPDMTLLAVAQIGTGDWRLAMVIWVGLAVLSVIIIALIVIARITKVDYATASYAALIVFLPPMSAAVLCPVDHPYNLFSPYLFFILPVSHGGPFLLAIAAALLASAMRWRLLWSRLLGLGALSIAVSCSDLLGLVSLLIPLTVALIATRLSSQMSLRTVTSILASSWGGAAIGWAIAGSLYRQPTPAPVIGDVPRHVDLLASALWRHPLALVLSLAWAIVLWRLARRYRLRRDVDDFWGIFALTSGVCTLALLAFRYVDFWSLRYALPLFWWAGIGMAVTITRLSKAFSIGLSLPALAIVAVLALVDTRPGMTAPRLLSWSLPLASCIENAGGHAGLAAYRWARLLNVSSDWRLQAVQVNAAGGAYTWGNDRLWATQDIHDFQKRPRYDFIVLDGLNKDAVAQRYGEPNRTLRCPSSDVWFYDHAGQIYRGLDHAWPSLASRGAARPRSAMSVRLGGGRNDGGQLTAGGRDTPKTQAPGLRQRQIDRRAEEG